MNMQMQPYPGANPANSHSPPFTDPYSQQKPNPQSQTYQSYKKEAEKEQTSQPSPCLYYILSCLLFLGAAGVNVGMWAIDQYALANTQASNYYSSAFPVSQYLNGKTFTDSTAIYSGGAPTDIKSIALSLVYSWLLWKLSLIVFTYNLSENEDSKAKKFGLVGILFGIMLAIDVLGSIFMLSIYNDYIFYGIYMILTIIVAVINNASKEKGKQALLNSVIPLLLISLFFASFCIFLPSLYAKYTSMSLIGASFLVIYIYFFYALLLFFGTYVEDNCKNFLGTIQFLLLGYAVGMIMLVGYTEVEFYYLLGYFIFRNVFSNWVMRKWERVVCNPPVLPGWGLMYYLSYLLNFLPVIGVGKLVVAMGFYSQIFSAASPMIYQYPNPLYPSSTWASTSINMSFAGSIFWLSGVIIWIGFTFTQQYQRRKPLWTDIFYYLFGIHLFYLGITSSLSIPIFFATSSSHL